jgi:hypothetical protein
MFQDIGIPIFVLKEESDVDFIIEKVSATDIPKSIMTLLDIWSSNLGRITGPNQFYLDRMAEHHQNSVKHSFLVVQNNF